MNAARKITLGTLATAAIFSGGVMAGRHWAKDTSEPPAGPLRIRAGILADTRNASPEKPQQARYRATTLFQINQSSAPDIIPSSVPRETSDQFRTNWYKSQVKAISSRSTLVLAVKNLKLGTEWKCSPDDAAARLAGMIKVEPEPNTDIVSLSAWSDKAEEAAAIANGVRDAYGQRRREAASERLQRLRQNHARMIEQEEAAVEKKRQEMLELINQHNIADPDPLGAVERPQTLEIQDDVDQAGAGAADQIVVVVADTDQAAVAAEPQKQLEYATGHTRYESMVPLLNSMLEHAERSAKEAASRDPIEILEPAVAVEDR